MVSGDSGDKSQRNWCRSCELCTPYRSPYLPAPVVPPARWEESNDGDWWIVYSLPLIEISTDGARGLSIPRLLLGMSCAKRRNDSIVR